MNSQVQQCRMREEVFDSCGETPKTIEVPSARFWIIARKPHEATIDKPEIRTRVKGLLRVAFVLADTGKKEKNGMDLPTEAGSP